MLIVQKKNLLRRKKRGRGLYRTGKIEYVLEVFGLLYLPESNSTKKNSKPKD